MSLKIDTIGALGATAATYFGCETPLCRGLQCYSAAVCFDRAIKFLMVGNGLIKGERTGSREAEMIMSSATAFLEESLYANLLLSNQHGFFWRSAAFATSFFLGITASRAFRHKTPEKQDAKDALIGLVWATIREIVQNTASPSTATFISVASNAAIFGLIEGGKFREDRSHHLYKTISSACFRVLADFAKIEKNSMTAPLTAHILFNLSRSFSD